MAASTSPQPETANKPATRSLLLGIAVWFVHQNLIYAIASVACRWEFFAFRVAGLPGPQIIDTIISLIALVIMAILIYIPWRSWREFQRERPTRNPDMVEDTEKDPRPMVSFVAMGLNSFFLLFVIATFVPMLSLHGCGSA